MTKQLGNLVLSLLLDLPVIFDDAEAVTDISSDL